MKHTSICVDRNLQKLQVNFLAMVLEFCLETSIGKFLVTTYINGNVRYVWFAVCNHYSTSTAALHASNQILTKLQKLNISIFTKQQDFLTQVQEHQNVTQPKLGVFATQFKIQKYVNVNVPIQLDRWILTTKHRTNRKFILHIPR